MLRPDDAPYGMGQHELSTVQKSQAFLGGQSQRLPSEHTLQLAAGISLALVVKLAQSQKRQAHVCQRCQVSGCSKRALLVYDRSNSLVEEIHQPLDRLDSYSRIAVRK